MQNPAVGQSQFGRIHTFNCKVVQFAQDKVACLPEFVGKAFVLFQFFFAESYVLIALDPDGRKPKTIGVAALFVDHI